MTSSYVEPEKKDRVWYHHVHSGWKGYLVLDENGETYVKVHVSKDPHYSKFSKQEWSPVRQLRPLQPGDVAHIAFDADRVLAKALGEDLPRAGWKKDWKSLTPEVRKNWITGDGPGMKVHPERQELYYLIKVHFRDKVV